MPERDGASSHTSPSIQLQWPKVAPMQRSPEAAPALRPPQSLPVSPQAQTSDFSMPLYTYAIHLALEHAAPAHAQGLQAPTQAPPPPPEPASLHRQPSPQHPLPTIRHTGNSTVMSGNLLNFELLTDKWSFDANTVETPSDICYIVWGEHATVVSPIVPVMHGSPGARPSTLACWYIKPMYASPGFTK